MVYVLFYVIVMVILFILVLSLVVVGKIIGVCIVYWFFFEGIKILIMFVLIKFYIGSDFVDVKLISYFDMVWVNFDWIIIVMIFV